MTSATFDFAPLLPAGLPAPAAKWTGLAKYSFIGGNVDGSSRGLIDAVNAVHEGKDALPPRACQRPQGYRPLRISPPSQRCGINCTADDILIVSGRCRPRPRCQTCSPAAIQCIEQTPIRRAEPAAARCDVGGHSARPWGHGWMLAAALADLNAAASPKYITIPTCRTRPARSCGTRRVEL